MIAPARPHTTTSSAPERRSSYDVEAVAQRLWAPGVRRGLLGRREQPSGQTRPFAHRRLHSAPFGGGDEERPTVFASQHARETAAIDGDGIEHLATLSHAYALLAGNAGDPHGTVSVRASSRWPAEISMAAPSCSTLTPNAANARSV